MHARPFLALILVVGLCFVSLIFFVEIIYSKKDQQTSLKKKINRKSINELQIRF